MATIKTRHKGKLKQWKLCTTFHHDVLLHVLIL